MANDKASTFVSYARDDSQFALRLVNDLKSAGAIVWLDQLDIAPGQRWDRTVEEALAACPRVLVVLSPSSVESNNVMDEVSFALEQGKVVIPVLHRDCTIPLRLRRMQYVDMKTEYERGLEQVLKTLNVDKRASDSKPTLFIGSSSDDLGPAYAAREALEDCALGIVWDRSAKTSSLSQSWLEPLLDALDEANFGLLVFVPGELTRLRKNEVKAVWDEVMFELGLMVGRFGKKGSFLIMPADSAAMPLPRGSLGLNTVPFTPPANSQQLPAALRPACNEVRRALRNLSPRPLLAANADETQPEPALALPDTQRKHLLNLAQDKTSYEGRGSLRAELRQLVSLGLLEKLPGRHIGDMQTGTAYNLADFVKLTDRGRRWVDNALRGRSRT